MKVGDLVKYSWNKEERPDQVELAMVLKTDLRGFYKSTSYIEILLIGVENVDPLCVPSFKLEVVSETR